MQLGIPRGYAALFDRNDLAACPLWRQAVPWAAERDPMLPAWARQASQACYGRAVPWHADAIGDLARLAAPRLTHRYHRRVLVHTTAACALYCRFCFRKAHLASREAELYRGSLQPAWDYLAAHPEVDEVIFSGGDPLTLSAGWWAQAADALRRLPHVKVLRVHSRIPATLPQRLDDALLRSWAGLRQQVVLVAHFNHPRELTARARHHLGRARRAGVVLLNQAVLLAGVNDTVRTQVRLARRLYQAGVVPYYVHHPDYTPNTFGFRLSLHRGRALMRRASAQLSGPMRPRYMLELPGGQGKVDVLQTSLRATARWSDAADGVGGRRYRLPVPRTRASAGASGEAAGSVDYLDLYPLAPSPSGTASAPA